MIVLNKYGYIDELKENLEVIRPLSEITLKSLHEDLILKWIYNSNAIEGNTLTLIETKVVLEGITIGGKSLREHFEVINHKEAIQYIEEIVSNKEELSEWQIKSIHNLILKNIDNDNAGKYRNCNVKISGAEHIPPEPYLLIEQMKELMEWYNNSTLHPIEKAAKLHVDFVKIHPFTDGNGRTSRLLMNFELMKNGYLPVVIKNEYRLEYYKALDKAHTKNDYIDFYSIIQKLEEEIMEEYVEIAFPEKHEINEIRNYHEK